MCFQVQIVQSSRCKLESGNVSCYDFTGFIAAERNGDHMKSAETHVSI